MSKSDSVLLRTFMSTTGMAVQGIARLVYTLLIGRLSGPQVLADVSTLLSISVYFALLMPAGLGIAASRYLPDQNFSAAAIHQLRSWYWLFSPLLAILAFPLALWLVSDPWAAAGCSLLVFAYNAYVFSRGALLGEDRIFRAMIADLLGSFVAITALLLVLANKLEWALLLPIALGYLVFALLNRAETKGSKRITAIQKKSLQRFVRDSVIGGLATGGLLPATMIIVRIYDAPAQAGLFAAALSLATPANIVAQALQQVLIPRFAGSTNSFTQLKESHRRIFVATGAFFTVIFSALIVLSHPILTVLYGSEFAEGALSMQLMLGVIFLVSVSSPSAALLISTNRQQIYALVWSLAFVIGVALMLLLAPFMGLMGAILGFAVGSGSGSIAVVAAAFRAFENSGQIIDRQESQGQ